MEHFMDGVFVGKHEAVLSMKIWRAAKLEKRGSLGIDQDELHFVRLRSKSDSREGKTQPFAFSAPGRTSDEEVTIQGICKIRETHLPFVIHTDRDEWHSLWSRVEDLIPHVGESHDLSIGALD